MFSEGAESVSITENLESGKYKDTKIVTSCEKCTPELLTMYVA